MHSEIWFCRNFFIFAKIYILWLTSLILPKISIVAQNFYFRPKFPFLPKISIFFLNLDFCSKFPFFVKNFDIYTTFFAQNFDFGLFSTRGIGPTSTEEAHLTMEPADDRDILTTDTNWLNNPKFVGIANTPDRVLFFISETDGNCAQTTNAPNSRRKDPNSGNVISRIASICKNDVGYKSIRVNLFTTFVKATISCNFGDFTFPILKGVAQSHDQLFTIFSTKRRTFHKSALCIYLTADIERNITDSGLTFEIFLILNENLYFWRKFWLLTKNFIFDANSDFWRKFLFVDENFYFLTKFFIFDEDFDFWRKFWFLTKIFIFDEFFFIFWRKFSFFDANSDSWRKFWFLMKILIFSEHFDFWRKFYF
mgnify:CR=1 FL=1